MAPTTRIGRWLRFLCVAMLAIPLAATAARADGSTLYVYVPLDVPPRALLIGQLGGQDRLLPEGPDRRPERGLPTGDTPCGASWRRRS